MKTLPLAGLRVIEFSQMVMGLSRAEVDELYRTGTVADQAVSVAKRERAEVSG